MTPLGPNAILSAEDAEFVDQMALIDSEIVRKEDILKEALTLAEPGRDEHLAALAEAGVRRTFEFMLQATQQLLPQQLQRDQRVYVVYLRDSIGFARRYEQAVEQKDLVAAHLDTIALLVARAKMLANVSALFCERTFAADSKALCDSSEPPGGSYGAALRPIFRQLSSEFLPTIEFFPSQYSPEEAASVFASLLDSRLIGTVQRAYESVQALNPPARLRLDHDRITRYLADTLDAALTMGATTENQNISADVDFGAYARLRNDAANDLSAEAKAIVAPYFHE
ncbi:MAG: hypothetical protein IIC91_13235 [Chloroflexi bacterium]|nr:hypothetical protein [Chloroflexota bacterium]